MAGNLPTNAFDLVRAYVFQQTGSDITTNANPFAWGELEADKTGGVRIARWKLLIGQPTDAALLALTNSAASTNRALNVNRDADATKWTDRERFFALIMMEINNTARSNAVPPAAALTPAQWRAYLKQRWDATH